MVTLGPLLETMAKIKRKCLSPRIAFFQWAVSCCQLSWGLILWVWSVLHFWQGCLSLESKVIFSTREIFHERVLSFDLSSVLSHLKRLCKLFLLTLPNAYIRICLTLHLWPQNLFIYPNISLLANSNFEQNAALQKGNVFFSYNSLPQEMEYGQKRDSKLSKLITRKSKTR